MCVFNLQQQLHECAHLQDGESRESLPSLCRELAPIIHRTEERQTVLQSGHVVLLSVSRGSVDKTRPCFGRDVIAAEDDLGDPVAERVLVPVASCKEGMALRVGVGSYEDLHPWTVETQDTAPREENDPPFTEISFDSPSYAQVGGSAAACRVLSPTKSHTRTSISRVYRSSHMDASVYCEKQRPTVRPCASEAFKAMATCTFLGYIAWKLLWTSEHGGPHFIIDKEVGECE